MPTFKLRACAPTDPIFLGLLAQLDRFLAVTDGDDHSFYAQFNGSDTLDYAVVLEDEAGTPLACGALRAKDEQRIEIKRMYTIEAARGQRLAEQVLNHLVLEAKQRGFKQAVLETGVRQPSAIRLYERAGFERIENYPPYADVYNSVCFGKKLE